MHVRFSSCLGLPVLSEDTDETVGSIAGVLIHPDTAAVEGFFVRGDRGTEFVAIIDVARFTTALFISSAEALAPLDEIVRLQTVIQSGRTVLNQRVRTERGRRLGTCRDVQINTATMQVEWLFPRRFWRWGVALPVSAVVEITPAAIIVQNEAVMGRTRHKSRHLVDVPSAEPVLPVVTRT